MKNIREEILADVNIAVHNLNNTYDEIDVRLQAAEASQNEIDSYLALQDTERQDAFTPQFLNLKLNADERLASSQITAVQTLISYNIAIKDIHRAQGTLLRYNNIKPAY